MDTILGINNDNSRAAANPNHNTHPTWGGHQTWTLSTEYCAQDVARNGGGALSLSFSWELAKLGCPQIP